MRESPLQEASDPSDSTLDLINTAYIIMYLSGWF